MSKAEERANEAHPDIPLPHLGEGIVAKRGHLRRAYIEGYEQAGKDTIAEVEKWLKANFHHHNCWNADEFCVSLRTHFGIEK